MARLPEIFRVAAGAAAALAHVAVTAGPFAYGPIRDEPGPFFLWDSQLTVRTGGGYKKNALLAATQRQDTGLAILGVEWMVFRPPVDANQVFFFFSGDQRYYLNPAVTGVGQPLATEEQVFLTHLAYKRTLTERLTAGLSLTHLYNQQVLDATEYGGDRGSVQVVGHGILVGPTLRGTLPAGFYVEAGLPLNRQFLRPPVSSFLEWGPKLTAGWNHTTNGSVEASFACIERPFDTREQADPLGVPIAGTRLTTHDLRSDLVWKQSWDAGRHFQTTARLFHVRRTDNGEGFTDYDRFGAATTLKLESKDWLLRGTARWTTYQFPRQVVSVFDPSLRTRDGLEFEGRVEYRWTKQFRLYGEFFHEQQRSNVASDDLHGHVWQVGIERDF